MRRPLALLLVLALPGPAWSRGPGQAAAREGGAGVPGRRGARGCEVRGRAATLDLVMVSPDGAAPFRLAVAGVAATLQVGAADEARGLHRVAVQGAIAFLGNAPAEWAHFVAARAFLAAGGVVRVARGVALGAVRGASDRGGGALATIEIGPGVQLPAVAVPCSALALDEPAAPEAVAAPREATDGTSFVARGRQVMLRTRAGAGVPGYAVEVEYPSALVLGRVRASGEHVLFDSWQPGAAVALSGWIEASELEGYLPALRGVTLAAREARAIEAPPPLERGVYEGRASIPAGTTVFAAAGGRGAWGVVRDDRSLLVRWKTDERWIQIVGAPGVSGLAGHAFVDRALVRLPLAPGRWRVTGAPLAGRIGHTTTLLRDGRVLVVGGWGPVPQPAAAPPAGAPVGRAPLATAELYLPEAPADVGERFVATGTMASGRSGHSATLLPDGRVLVAGGERLPAAEGEEGIALAGAELYDAARGTFTRAGTMAEARFGHTATLLGDGTVLIAGGDNGHGRALPSAEVWDPRELRFRAAGRMGTRRYDHTATRLASGHVLLVGGRHKNYALRDFWTTFPIDLVEVYDPERREFRDAGELPGGGRTRHSVTALPGGRMLLAGGARATDLDLAGIARAALLYEPALDLWTGAGEAGAREEEARGEHSATPLADGRVVIVAGSSTLAYDVTTHRWESLAPPVFERVGHTATLLSDGRILVVGGESPDEPPVVTRPGAELYRPAERR